MNKIEQVIKLLKESKYPVCLTGAGISTPSGVPDFRSPQSGLWQKYDPFEVAHIESFMRSPGRFYDFIRPLKDVVRNAKPNPAHIALARLEDMGKMKAVITQNIDNLHQLAGSKNVIELHGNAQRGFCLKCKKFFQREEIDRRVSESNIVPLCSCGGVIKLDVILFGEMLPVDALRRAEYESCSSDLFFVIGSSLTVSPASYMPQLAQQNNAKIVIINFQKTYMDSLAEVVINDAVEVVLAEIEKGMRRQE